MLETQLERLRKLQVHFSKKSQQIIIRKQLELLAGDYTDIPWSASAMYELANLVRSMGFPVEAHYLAEKGHTSYPNSMGGQLCKSLMDSIESPDFGVQTMTVDDMQQRSIQIRHRNMTKLHFRAFKLNFDRLLKQRQRYDLNLDYHEIPKIVHERRPDFSWTVELEDPGDYEDHNTYVTPPLDEMGLYLIAGSVTGNFSKQNNRIDAVTFLLSPIVITASQSRNPLEIQVFHGDTGDPVSGAGVEIYPKTYGNDRKEMFSGKTDANGRITFHNTTDYYGYIAVARWKNTFVFNSFYSYNYRTTPQTQHSHLIYTDRSIYRPGQTLYFKVLAFEGKDSDYTVVPEYPISVSLSDPNGETVASENFKTNAFGTVSGSMEIPGDRLLGNYRLFTSHGSSNIRVEEYKRPTFEVEMERLKEDMKLNKPAKVKGTAKYYFGLPVAEGDVSWRVVRRPRWPFWYFWCYFIPPDIQSDYEIAAGSTQINADGTFEIDFLPESDPDIEDKSITYSFEITADITDSGGETRSGIITLNLGYCAVEATITQKSSFYTEDKPPDSGGETRSGAYYHPAKPGW